MVGLMYLGTGPNGAQAPDGFAGPNDHWHRHSGVCLKGGRQTRSFPVDADVTRAQCEAKGGGFFMGITTWMVHAWVVPGLGESVPACSRTRTRTCLAPTERSTPTSSASARARDLHLYLDG